MTWATWPPNWSSPLSGRINTLSGGDEYGAGFFHRIRAQKRNEDSPVPKLRQGKTGQDTARNARRRLPVPLRRSVPGDGAAHPSRAAEAADGVFGRRWRLSSSNSRFTKPGATGNFPRGKARPGDKGELACAMTHNGSTIYMDFGTPVTWLAMSADEAIAWSAMLARRALMVRAMPEDEIVRTLGAMAVAPDLLASCKSLISRAIHSCVGGEPDCQVCKALAVIRKAEGGAS
jgi:hypothetical protein